MNEGSAQPKQESPTVSVAQTTMSFGIFGIILIVIFVIILMFTYNYGSARLAYCAFARMGYGEGGAFIASIIAWFFSGLYYPIHAIFISNECATPVATVMSGGRRKR